MFHTTDWNSFVCLPDSGYLLLCNVTPKNLSFTVFGGYWTRLSGPLLMVFHVVAVRLGWEPFQASWLPCLVAGAGCPLGVQLGCQLQHLCVATPCGLGFLPSWQLVPRGSDPREPGRSLTPFMTSPIVLCYFHHTILAKEVDTKVCLGLDLSSRAGVSRDSISAVFSEINLLHPYCRVLIQVAPLLCPQQCLAQSR